MKARNGDWLVSRVFHAIMKIVVDTTMANSSAKKWNSRKFCCITRNSTPMIPTMMPSSGNRDRSHAARGKRGLAAVEPVVDDSAVLMRLSAPQRC